MFSVNTQLKLFNFDDSRLNFNSIFSIIYSEHLFPYVRISEN